VPRRFINLGIVPIFMGRRSTSLRSSGSQTDNQEDVMSQAPAMNNHASSNDNDRENVLAAVSARWKRLSPEEISALRTSRELIALVVAKYGIKTNAARRDVEALLDGRTLTA
jgi:hypothetical protein